MKSKEALLMSKLKKSSVQAYHKEGLGEPTKVPMEGLGEPTKVSSSLDLMKKAKVSGLGRFGEGGPEYNEEQSEIVKPAEVYSPIKNYLKKGRIK